MHKYTQRRVLHLSSGRLMVWSDDDDDDDDGSAQVVKQQKKWWYHTYTVNTANKNQGELLLEKLAALSVAPAHQCAQPAKWEGDNQLWGGDQQTDGPVMHLGRANGAIVGAVARTLHPRLHHLLGRLLQVVCQADHLEEVNQQSGDVEVVAKAVLWGGVVPGKGVVVVVVAWGGSTK